MTTASVQVQTLIVHLSNLHSRLLDAMDSLVDRSVQDEAPLNTAEVCSHLQEYSGQIQSIVDSYPHDHY